MVSKSSVKYIQSLQQKKFRDEYGVFVAEGPKLVTELIADGSFPLKALFGIPIWLETFFTDHADIPQSVVSEVQQEELIRISGLKTPNSCLAIFEKKAIAAAASTGSLILMLDELQDPGNLGTIIRTADWFGVNQIICSPGTADCYNPKVVQSTMASLGRVNLVYQDLMKWLDGHPAKYLLCSSLHGSPLTSVEQQPNQVLVIGNEAHGISAPLLSRASGLVTIPRRGKAESLNAAVATGILLAHLASK